MKVTFEDQTNIISNVKYQMLPDNPIQFSRATFGSFKGRSLIMGGKNSKTCFEFDKEKYQVIPSLNVKRWFAASTFISNKVVVAGGYHYRHLDSRSCCGDNEYNNRLDYIEILGLDKSNHGSQWIESPSRLPIKVFVIPL